MKIRALIVPLVLWATLGAAPQDDRKADREAIRAHIDSIFQAFINKDAAKLRATHHQHWLGYLEGSRTMIRGVDGYMNNNYVDLASPYGMKSYKMREFDMIFKGDAAFVCFVADVESNTPSGLLKRVLRISDFYTKQDGQWIQTGSDTDLHPESAEEQQQAPRSLSDQGRKRLLDTLDGRTEARTLHTALQKRFGPPPASAQASVVIAVKRRRGKAPKAANLAARLDPALRRIIESDAKNDSGGPP